MTKDNLIGVILFIALIVVPIVGNIRILFLELRGERKDGDPYGGGYDDGGFPW